MIGTTGVDGGAAVPVAGWPSSTPKIPPDGDRLGGGWTTELDGDWLDAGWTTVPDGDRVGGDWTTPDDDGRGEGWTTPDDDRRGEGWTALVGDARLVPVPSGLLGAWFEGGLAVEHVSSLRSLH